MGQLTTSLLFITTHFRQNLQDLKRLREKVTVYSKTRDTPYLRKLREAWLPLLTLKTSFQVKVYIVNAFLLFIKILFWNALILSTLFFVNKKDMLGCQPFQTQKKKKSQ